MDNLGLLSEEAHECAWHAKATPGDGMHELMGVFCTHPVRPGEILLDDAEVTIGNM